MLVMLLASLAAVASVVAGLWAWQRAAELSSGASRPDAVAWAVRSAAVAAVAAGQALVLSQVVGRVYDRRPLDDVLRVSAVTVCLVALVSAVSLGLAGR